MFQQAAGSFGEVQTQVDQIINDMLGRQFTRFCPTSAWQPVTRVDHGNVLGSCSSCHDGAKATGKPAGHVVTLADCSACHGSLAWKPAGFDHSEVTQPCASCHDGTNATGKSPSPEVKSAAGRAGGPGRVTFAG